LSIVFEDDFAYELQKFIEAVFNQREVKVQVNELKTKIESFEAFNDELLHVNMEDIDKLVFSCKI